MRFAVAAVIQVAQLAQHATLFEQRCNQALQRACEDMAAHGAMWCRRLARGLWVAPALASDTATPPCWKAIPVLNIPMTAASNTCNPPWVTEVVNIWKHHRYMLQVFGTQPASFVDVSQCAAPPRANSATNLPPNCLAFPNPAS